MGYWSFSVPMVTADPFTPLIFCVVQHKRSPILHMWEQDWLLIQLPPLVILILLTTNTTSTNTTTTTNNYNNNSRKKNILSFFAAG